MKKRSQITYESILTIKPENITIPIYENFYPHHGYTEEEWTRFSERCKKLDSPVNLVKPEYLQNIDAEIFEVLANNLTSYNIHVDLNGNAMAYSWLHRLLALKKAGQSIIVKAKVDADVDIPNTIRDIDFSKLKCIIAPCTDESEEICSSFGLRPLKFCDIYKTQFLLLVVHENLHFTKSLVNKLFENNIMVMGSDKMFLGF